MDFPKDYELLDGPWVPMTPNRPPVSVASWLSPDEILAGMNGSSSNLWDPTSWTQPMPPPPLRDTQAQSLNNPMNMSYRTLLALSDPNFTNFPPHMLAQLAARGNARQMMPPAPPNHNHFNQSNVPPRQNQLAQIIAARGISGPMMRPSIPRQNQLVMNLSQVSHSSSSGGNSQAPQMFAPNHHYGLPIPLLPNLNVAPENNNTRTASVSKSVSVTPANPAYLVNNTRPQDFQQNVEIIDLVGDSRTMPQNVPQNEFRPVRQTPREDLLPVAMTSQQQETQVNVMPSKETLTQQAEGENENPGIDLNRTPEPKQKRKKHRPKVIREDKKAKTAKPVVTPKVVTPQHARKTEVPPRTKRKYVRKNKDLNASQNPVEAVGEIVDTPSLSGSKPVRRGLSFDTEENQARDENVEPNVTVPVPQHVGGASMGSSENVRNTFDLNTSVNQCDNEYASAPQPQKPPLQHSTQRMMQPNQFQDGYMRMLNNAALPPSSAGMDEERLRKLAKIRRVLSTVGNNPTARAKIAQALLTGMKRNRGAAGDGENSGCTSSTHAYNGMNRHSENNNDMRSHEMHKKLRVENMQNERTSFNSNNGGSITVQEAQNTSRMFTLADAQKFMAYEKFRNSQRMLQYHQTMNTARNTPPQRISAPMQPSGHNNAGSYQLSTPGKPSEFSSNMNVGPRARIEALIATNRLRAEAKEREKMEKFIEARRLEKEAAYLAKQNPSRNTSPLRIGSPQDSQGTNKNSRNLKKVVQYVDPIEEIIQKLHRLSLYGENKNVTGQVQQALVPYAGGVGAIVPFEGKKKKPRPKVDLDPESDRVWRLLMGGEGDTEMGPDKEKWWEEERRVFRGRADAFISRMHLIQGDRRFSKWKGSVVDSVIGVFLTQNVSDHLSSSAFMSLVARFPLSSGDKTCVPSDDSISEHGNTSDQQSSDPSSVIIQEITHVDEKETGSNHESPESNTGSSTSDYVDSNNLNSHESPDGSVTAVTFTSSTSGVKFDDRSSAEDVVSSQNSVASQNFSNHVQAADRGKQLDKNLNFDDDLLSGCIGNGFSSFTELLKMASSGRPPLAEHSAGINQFRNVSFDAIPSFPNLLDFQTMQSGITSTSHAPSMSGTYQNSQSSKFEGLENTSCAIAKSSQSVAVHRVNSLGSESRAELNSCGQSYVVKETSLSGENMPVLKQPESDQHVVNTQSQIQTQTFSKEQSSINQEKVLEGVGEVKPIPSKEAAVSAKVISEDSKSAKTNKLKQEAEKKKSFDWDSLRRQVLSNGPKKERSCDANDSLDYEALRNADVNVIANAIRERGMNNMLAERMKEFLNRLVKDHGSVDLEWLRDVPPDKAKDYLLSIRGLGLKSVECVRLLTLHHLAFPVDTNVGRICVRLGWVPLQPLPESLQLHLLEMYPLLETIQKYLWPRLCKLDQRTLYELHYQLITFGKVFCTKSKPNCNACPMRGECKHFASAFASARLALPGPEEKGLVSSTHPPKFPEGNPVPMFKPMPLPQLSGITHAQERQTPRNKDPIIEEPASPEPEPATECLGSLESEIEDAFFDDPDDEIPTIQLNMKEFTQNLQSYMQENNLDIKDGDMSRALVAIAPESASIPMPKLKNVSRLRTEHQVYELPDTHPLLEGLDKRERDDPSPYLLAIWTPGETAQSTEPPKMCCDSQDTGNLCAALDCFSCNSIREAKAQLVRGTILIPCRTAMRGSFPLNGTYFQVNEVFADHDSSRNPIHVPRNWIWNLPRRTVYFGTSVTTIFKGLTTEGIQHCFWRGFVCVRGFDKTSRSPRPLYARLHLPPSKTTKDKKPAADAPKKE